ncbi:hypothetical protein HY091_00995, partial [Candidatus Kaiserbacteria bacterium]|nr:hypothetical protein [Candidatus Kaiserbacteria bacterium]
MVTTAEKRFGLILRVFAKKPEQVRAEAQETADTARQAASITVDGRRLFEEIKIVVASDTNRIDYDCGETAPLLEEML